MKQKTALFIASGLTAFTLVGLGMFVGSLNNTSAQTTEARTTEVTPPPWPSAITASSSLALAAPVPDRAAEVMPSAATTSYTTQVALSPERALEIALARVPGATAQRMPELVDFQGTVAYEVMLDAGPVYVDANSAAVLYDGAANASSQRDDERDDHDDDEREYHGEKEAHDDHDHDDHDKHEDHDEHDDED